jgi:DNA-binding MarR family transcriptional regulator
MAPAGTAPNGDTVDQILAQWRRERPELEASPMGIIGRIARITKYLERSVHDTVSEFGLNPGEFDVLATLRRSGTPYRLSPTRLFSAMMVSSGTMTHRIDRLEQAHLVERTPDPSDRRGTLIQLTDQGLALIEKAVEAHVDNARELLTALDASEQEQLAQLLRKLLVAFNDIASLPRSEP